MTCTKANRTIFRPFILLLGTLVLANCSSTTNPTTTQATPLSQATERLTELFGELSRVTNNLQTITAIDQCRFEITTHWNSESQGHYRATHSQRFSLKHDLRSVDHSPNYIATFDGKQQQWQEKLQLTYNRLLPYKFSYYDSKTFEHHQNTGSDDQFSLVGFKQAPITLMKAIEGTFIEIAELCGNNINKIEHIEHKMIGYWNIANDNVSIGELSISANQALLIKDQQTIRGPYEISHQDDYYHLVITPADQAPIHVALDFIHSNYARIFILNDNNQAIEFRPLNQTPQNNDGQLHLFRLGDLL